MIFCMYAFGIQSWTSGVKNEKKQLCIMSTCRGHKAVTWGEEDAAGKACSKPCLPRTPSRRLKIPELFLTNAPCGACPYLSSDQTNRILKKPHSLPNVVGWLRPAIEKHAFSPFPISETSSSPGSVSAPCCDTPTLCCPETSTHDDVSWLVRIINTELIGKP
jgi:hypothetical protein